jgi:hypothetical protein
LGKRHLISAFCKHKQKQQKVNIQKGEALKQ